MAAALREHRVYHVSPWRRAVPGMVVGPFGLLGLGLCLFAPRAEDQAGGIIMLVILVPLGLGLHLLINYARLELDAEGVRLRQVGMKLSAPWSNIAGLRLEPRREGIVTHQPLEGAGAAKLAALRGMRIYYTPMYNAEQRALMGQRRWIPIEAFAWHLKHGRLHDDLVGFAPAVQPLDPLVKAPSPETPQQRRRSLLLFFGILAVSFGVIIPLGLGPPSRAERFFAVTLAILAPLLTAVTVWRAWNSFRMHARLVGVLFAILAFLGVLWCIVAWNDLAQIFASAN